ncbi:MAG: hypothetical protein A2902_03610 [Elusimicrobia bacterium RIFCSPLOWO2_01_FULL_64_13]|nr:MAG: hypothetical protein A2636_05675 [Elusimicrobia bacterium RIFCSPHIGHO2_01_FULL_64_10]OGR97183.1 MAG: hypothetical protein A2902_03610 [Elusimicrobia bacterium RIFCSPLOWO2_01_FULL_64_13]
MHIFVIPHSSGPHPGGPIGDGGKCYLLVIDDYRIEEVVKKDFNSGSHRIFPHESGLEFLFYCVASGSGADEDMFIQDLHRKLEERLSPKVSLEGLEFHLCKGDSMSARPIHYRVESGEINRFQFNRRSPLQTLLNAIT